MKLFCQKNSDDALVIDFDFLNCIAQLSVTNSQYVPYQFVYFGGNGYRGNRFRRYNTNI